LNAKIDGKLGENDEENVTIIGEKKVSGLGLWRGLEISQTNYRSKKVPSLG